MTGDRTVGGDVPAPRRELGACLSVAALSLAAAAACHRFAPGLGAVIKPLLWPLVLVPFAIRPRYVAATAFAVPLLSHLMTGMPTLPVALTLACGSAVFTVLLLVLVRTVGGGLRPPRMFRMARSAEDVRPYHAVGGDVSAPRMFRMARSAEDVRPYHAVGGDVPAPRNPDETRVALGVRLRSAEDVRPYHAVGGDVSAPRMFDTARSAEDVRPYQTVGGALRAPRNHMNNA